MGTVDAFAHHHRPAQPIGRYGSDHLLRRHQVGCVGLHRLQGGAWQLCVAIEAQEPFPLAVGDQHFDRVLLAALGDGVRDHLAHPVPVQVTGKHALGDAPLVQQRCRHIEKAQRLAVRPRREVPSQEHGIVRIANEAAAQPGRKPGPQ